MSAEAVVARLAAFKPLRAYPVGLSCQQQRCVFCDEVGPYYDPPPFEHAPDCLWLAAQRLTG